MKPVFSLLSVFAVVVILSALVYKHASVCTCEHCGLTEGYCTCVNPQGFPRMYCHSSNRQAYLEGNNETQDFGKVKRDWGTYWI